MSNSSGHNHHEIGAMVTAICIVCIGLFCFLKWEEHLEFPSDLMLASENDFSSLTGPERHPPPMQLLTPQGIESEMMREKLRKKKGIPFHNGSHGTDRILSQVPPESGPRWEQCPNMGSVVCLTIAKVSSPFALLPPSHTGIKGWSQWRGEQLGGRRSDRQPKRPLWQQLQQWCQPGEWSHGKQLLGWRVRWLVWGLRHTWTYL